MMKKTRSTFFKRAFLLLGVISFVAFSACTKEDDPVVVDDPIAIFEYTISEVNYLQVSFENYSQNAETYSWNFGDGQTSTEENPTHAYAEAGSYTVVLIAANSEGTTHNYSQSFTITDPDLALKLLTGETSKTWKLFREGISMSVGPNADNPAGYWPGLKNDGDRPCLYEQEFTFHFDGTYEFDSNGAMWGEYGIWGNVEGHDNSPLYNTCFATTTENMVNAAGEDVSAWGTGTHSFTYDTSTGVVTLTGEGAWIGIPKLGTTGESRVPVNSVSFDVTIEEHTGYDLLKVVFDYGDNYWPIVYVSYSDPSLEPALVTEADEVPALDKITPTEIFITFAADDAAEKATIDVVESGSTVTFGVDDPLDATAAKVGQFNRTDAQHQELQFRAAPELKDIQFDNFTNAKVDIYIPADTDFTADGLKRKIVLGFADRYGTASWWESPTQFVLEDDDVVLGEWTTYTFDLTEVKARDDIDMIYLQIGDGDHTTPGTFYVRNLKFE